MWGKVKKYIGFEEVAGRKIKRKVYERIRRKNEFNRLKR